ncbi:hypothetical protein R1flu_009098 [Riccia fluitans]|uniref:Protein kinase domain-containing protein n=1 Tax=Riccia fluitans TaxID=41844 RepID=A0ABD1Z141_9MARC
MPNHNRELEEVPVALAKEDMRAPFFKYDELKTATGGFSEQNKLGQGGFGSAYKAVLSDRSVVAMKVVEPTDQNDELGEGCITLMFY